MGKRKPVIVLSSSEDDVVQSRFTGGGSSKSRSKPLSAARKKTRGGRSEQGDDGGSDPRHSREAEADEFARLSEDFCDCLQDFDLTRGSRSTKWKELWVEKYKPGSMSQLAVHKKKVEEVKSWLEDRLMTTKGGFGNVLLLTGQAGVGKSAAVRVIASQLGAQLCEWITPTPTLWQEHVHNVNSGLRYMSKLDEFEAFTEKIGSYSLLCPNSAGASSKPTIIVIDDLPVTNGRVAFGRLKKCLTSLTCSARLPTIILITEYHNIELVDKSTNHSEELVSSLERAGAHKVAFNPLTVNSIKKVLSVVCQEENCDVTPEQVDHIAKASGGDIRNAITSLQYCCLRPENLIALPVSTPMAVNARLDSDSSRSSPFTGLVGHGELNCSTYFPNGRDETLTFFHALGKFLHNKREVIDAFDLVSESLILRETFMRNPLKMDAPEKVLSQAFGQARPVTDFLHENVLDFISDGAIDDACMVASYLSDADCLLTTLGTSRSRIFNEMHEPHSISQSVAASVAIRGVLFGNSQPLSSRWHAIRRPRLWQIEYLAQRHMNQVLTEKFDAFNGFSFSLSQIVTEYPPTIRWLSSQTTDVLGHKKHVQYPTSEVTSADDYCQDNSNEGSFNEEIEDDIEDWYP